MKIRPAMVVLWFLATGFAQAEAAPDPDLKALMDQTGLKYEWTDSGNAMVTFNYDTGRHQTVYIMKETQAVDGLNLREVWSNAGTLPDPSSSATLQDLLTGGGNEAVGAWLLEKNDNGYLAYYSAKLPSVSGKDLASVLKYVASVADTEEQAISEDDDN